MPLGDGLLGEDHLAAEWSRQRGPPWPLPEPAHGAAGAAEAIPQDQRRQRQQRTKSATGRLWPVQRPGVVL